MQRSAPYQLADYEESLTHNENSKYYLDLRKGFGSRNPRQKDIPKMEMNWESLWY